MIAGLDVSQLECPGHDRFDLANLGVSESDQLAYVSNVDIYTKTTAMQEKSEGNK